MKASIRLRDSSGGSTTATPLLRAKLPVTLLGVRAVAGISAGDPADLRLDVATAAASLPCLRLSYSPNHPTSPISLSIRVGSGPNGSPSASGSAISMAASVSLTTGAVSFSLLFKPRLGDFSVRKVIGSSPGSESKVTVRSVVPVRGGAAAVRVRWGVRIPVEVHATTGEVAEAGVAIRRLPYLVVDKVTVERSPAKAAVVAPANGGGEKVAKKVRKEEVSAAAAAEEGWRDRQRGGGRPPEMVGTGR